MRNKEPNVYVIILTWNQYDLTVSCIRSFFDINYTNYRIAVVDNGSTDNTIEKLKKEFGNELDYISNGENLGYAGGNNVGIRYALKQGADYVLVVNNDTTVASDFLTPMIQRAESNPMLGVVTPKIYYMYEPQKIWAVGGRINWWLNQARNYGQGQLDTGQFCNPEKVDYATGCALLAKREVWEKIGLLDERFFIYYEDTDWCIRARESGYQIWYEPQSIMWHVAGAAYNIEATNAKKQNISPFRVYLGTRNNLWFIRCRAKGVKKLFALFAYFVRKVLLRLVKYTLTAQWKIVGELWRGLKDGLRRRDCDPVF